MINIDKNEDLLKDAPDYEDPTENVAVLSCSELRALGLLNCNGCCNSKNNKTSSGSSSNKPDRCSTCNGCSGCGNRK